MEMTQLNSVQFFHLLTKVNLQLWKWLFGPKVECVNFLTNKEFNHSKKNCCESKAPLKQVCKFFNLMLQVNDLSELRISYVFRPLPGRIHSWLHSSWWSNCEDSEISGIDGISNAKISVREEIIKILALDMPTVLSEAFESDDGIWSSSTMLIDIWYYDVSFLGFFQSWKMDKMNMGLEHLS